MIDELNQAIDQYYKKWQALTGKAENKQFFDSLVPTSVAWKAIDIDDFSKRFMDLRDQADQIHFGWINERWLVTLHLRDTKLSQGITLIKLMQRRPGSTDATGLDHIDFYSKDVSKSVLEKEPSLKWSEETNGEVCKWLSIWFDNTEAKLRTETVLDVCSKELTELEANILRQA